MNNPLEFYLANARYLPSPNCNVRPQGVTVDLLVIHNISLPEGSFGNGYVEQLFSNCLDCHCHPSFADLQGLEVSAHLFIDRQGDVCQFVPFNMRAWHAGQSCFQGREQCNDYSIGIELEGTDDSPYTDQQYQQLVAVTQSLMQQFPAITKNRIVGHSDIAPDRKTDPGPLFEWDYYLGQL